MDILTGSWRKFRAVNAVIVCTLILFAGLRFIIVTHTVTVHNDERHYAIDGLWVKAELPPAVVIRDLLYNHMNPHPLYDFRSGSIAYHGKMSRDQAGGKGDLGPYPRGGHPCLYMLVLGAIFAILPTTWLLQSDHYVHLARAVSICFDTAALLLLFDILRRLFSSRIACTLLAALLVMPYVFVNGALAYLDSFAHFWTVLGLWYYLTRARFRQGFQDWLIIGILMAFAILSKQSNLVVLPLLACVMVLFPPHAQPKTLLPLLSCAVVSGIVALCLFSSPIAFQKELQRTNKQVYGAQSPRKKTVSTLEKAAANLSLPFRPARHYHFGMARHKGKPYVKHPVLSKAYELATPLAAAAVYLSCALLFMRGRFTTWPMIGIALLFIAVIPLENVLRRLYVLIPYGAIIVALGITEVECLAKNFLGRKNAEPRRIC